jgi:hypothetical protein
MAMVSAIAVAISVVTNELNDHTLLSLIKQGSGIIKFETADDQDNWTSFSLLWADSRVLRVQEIEFWDPRRYKDKLRLITKFPNIKKLQIYLPDPECFALLPESRSLQKLIITGFQISEGDLKYLSRMPNLQELVLTDLGLGYSSLQPGSLKAIPTTLKLDTLHIHISGTVEHSHLIGLERLQRLKSLSICTNKVGSLSSLQHIPGLRRLHLRVHPWFGEFTEHCLSEAFSIRGLEELSLAGEVQRTPFLTIVLPCDSELQSLSLCDLKRAFVLLDQIPRLRKLRYLDVSRVDMIEFGGLPRVEQLRILER